ncbi:MAG: trigger factor, partial [Candidatus Levybacteria bacterium CG10_big_fil_rev_8_21_14_0_10_36_7]
MKEKHMQKPGSIREVEISLTGDEFETYWKEAHESALEKVSLKGFRKGTAPKELADQAVDKDAVFHTAVEAAARINLKELAEENNWTFIDTPKIEVLEATKKTGKEKPGLRYKAHLTIFPEVILGEYKKIAEKVLKSKKEVSISDEEIEKSLAWLRDSRAKQILKNGTAERGDVIEGDISSMVDGKAITGGDLKGDTFVLGQSRFVPGFDDMLIGKKAGEEATFSLTAPNDYWQKDLQNKEIAFTVYIKGVYTREFPPIDDAFANMLSPQFKTLDDLKKNMREGLLFERKEKEKERMRGEILEKIISESKIDLPEV